ncbi:hypothetical protein H072_333 [Dactylellina haptotyla CBS 200.50]|uniref:WLM domain-containing protein n=1 Tax=Dactylellina haptotyla (strain CBS 200.50) TaxID=1284197 RepID=S8CDA0_DACHA|nr:hypothetical protein H072_333 [Dactylellina haptotyla CBS 200.50]
MPLGFERLNEKVQRPNKHINFIKPLEGPDKAIAQDILERVAAVVYPIMKKHVLYVMALEEFPPNREFWGRNFNGGEVIQLVLKNPHNGMWLPMPMIQSVMLHELAHNKEMNHSRRFHKHRLGYVGELSELKTKGYTGEGFWGKGRSLHPSADLGADYQLPKEELPEELCGGVYKREKRKKKDSKKKIDYQEQKRRRIIKKFGSLEGKTIGGDEDIRQELEKGRKPKGKPRVAGSARGRDLRAEAALKRFETQKKEDEIKKDESATESGSEEEEEPGEMIKLEDDDVDMKAMIDEMSAFACGKTEETELPEAAFPEIDDKGNRKETDIKQENVDSEDSQDLDRVPPKRRRKLASTITISDDDDPPVSLKKTQQKSASRPRDSKSKTEQATISTKEILGNNNPPAERICNACQVSNDPVAATCLVCSNVLRDDVVSWECQSVTCKDSSVGYRNSIDVSYCGVCGTKR